MNVSAQIGPIPPDARHGARRFKGTGGVPGWGQALICLPLAWGTISRAADPGAETTSGAGKPPVVPEATPWIPRTLVEGRLTSAADLAHAVEQLRSNPDGGTDLRPRAPSPMLLGLLEASREAGDGGQAPPLERSPKRVAASEGEKRPGASHPIRRLLARAGKMAGRTMSVGKAPKAGATPAPHSDYVTVLGRAPFHAFDDSPERTILLEVKEDQVARVKSQGKEWTWIQLDNGLMGVVRNRHVRGAVAGEIEGFLALERTSGGRSEGSELAIGIVDLDGTGVPVMRGTEGAKTSG
ncbi:MAG: hypothetical protein KGS60_18745 [Verrucomicrobia bacterium]|nr:hypothetical protein [Verrucomicrobiota bacterium]